MFKLHVWMVTSEFFDVICPVHCTSHDSLLDMQVMKQKKRIK